MWIVIKSIDGKIGVVVGPFVCEASAHDYSQKCLVGSLGYEKWDVRKVEHPTIK